LCHRTARALASAGQEASFLVQRPQPCLGPLSQAPEHCAWVCGIHVCARDNEYVMCCIHVGDMQNVGYVCIWGDMSVCLRCVLLCVNLSSHLALRGKRSGKRIPFLEPETWGASQKF
jgi:hypothetical protein